MGVGRSEPEKNQECHTQTRVFVCLGQKSRLVRQLLLERGWREGSLQDERVDFFWCPRAKHAQSVARSREAQGKQPIALVNHFVGGAKLHGKHWLGRCLQACPRCANEIFPRQYYLGRESSLKLFLEDFLLTALQTKGACSRSASGGSGLELEERLQALLQRAMRQGKALDKPLPNSKYRQPLVSCSHDLELLVSFQEVAADHSNVATTRPPTKDVQCSSCAVVTERLTPEDGERMTEEPCRQSRSLDGPGNAWIVKPAMSSRGRGVAVFRDIRCLLDYAGRGGNLGAWEFVVQKYVEYPLLLAGCKVDLRVWVVVSSWSPLVACVYQEPYVRQASMPLIFDSVNANGLLPKQAHVTNRTVHSYENRYRLEDFLTRLAEEKTVTTDGNNTGGVHEIWKVRTWPQLLDGVRSVLLAAQPALSRGTRANQQERAFELYGFDFALDKDMRPWLLEANCSPDMLAGEDGGPHMQQWAREASSSLLDLICALPQGRKNTAYRRRMSAAELEVEPRPVLQSVQIDAHDAPDLKGQRHRCYGRILGSLPAELVSGLPLDHAPGWRLILHGTKGVMPVARISKKTRSSGEKQSAKKSRTRMMTSYSPIAAPTPLGPDSAALGCSKDDELMNLLVPGIFLPKKKHASRIVKHGFEEDASAGGDEDMPPRPKPGRRRQCPGPSWPAEETESIATKRSRRRLSLKSRGLSKLAQACDACTEGSAGN
mmetsp:Transcript_56887/g.133675  ORF Transcript_56887/g.133675 Transcript_56887/m.133675 type:complete len:715 (+) Transcript_56887:42-2186(+)